MQERYSAPKSGVALPSLSPTPGGARMLYEHFANISIPPPLTEQGAELIQKNIYI